MSKFIEQPLLGHYYKIGNLQGFMFRPNVFTKGPFEGVAKFLGTDMISYNVPNFGLYVELVINNIYYPIASLSRCCLVEEIDEATFLEAKKNAKKLKRKSR